MIGYFEGERSTSFNLKKTWVQQLKSAIINDGQLHEKWKWQIFEYMCTVFFSVRGFLFCCLQHRVVIGWLNIYCQNCNITSSLPTSNRESTKKFIEIFTIFNVDLAKKVGVLIRYLWLDKMRKQMPPYFYLFNSKLDVTCSWLQFISSFRFAWPKGSLQDFEYSLTKW